MLPLDVRPGIRSIPPYNGTALEHITVFDNKGNSFDSRGERALIDYKHHYRGTDQVLYHGTFRSPSEIGLTLLPQQAQSRHITHQLSPHGSRGVSASDSYKFPLVRSFFHRDSPTFKNFPKDEFLLTNVLDVTGREITIVTKKGLEAVRKANPTGFVFVLHENQPDGTHAERFQEPDGIRHEYRFYRPATPVFVMPVTINDLGWNAAIVEDTKLAEEIHANRNRRTLENFAYGNNIVDIYGDPFFDNTYFRL